jgi:hypothetical protein
VEGAILHMPLPSRAIALATSPMLRTGEETTTNPRGGKSSREPMVRRLRPDVWKYQRVGTGCSPR